LVLTTNFTMGFVYHADVRNLCNMTVDAVDSRRVVSK
jgi:hypothetical protein